MAQSLWSQANTPTGSGRADYPYSVSARFALSSEQFLLAVSYWCPSGSTRPAGWRLYRSSDGHLVAFSDAPGWTGAIPGWGTSTLSQAQSTAIGPLEADVTYDVTLFLGSGNPPWMDGGSAPDGGEVFSYEGSFAAVGDAHPTSSSGTGRFVVSATVDASPAPAGGGAPATPPDVDANLTSWFSSDSATNTHHSDLPWRTDANVTTLKGEAEGVNGFAAIKAVADAVAAAVSGLPGTIAGAVTTITGQLTALVGTVTDTSTVTIGRIIHDLAAVAINTQDSLVELARLSEGSGTFPSDVGTLVWTMLDETDFAGAIAWAQPADVYVLSITARPHGLPLNFTDGVHTIYRCGWWTPLNGSFARQRHYIDFEDNHLEAGAERLPGILVCLQPGGEGHLQAWALT